MENDIDIDNKTKEWFEIVETYWNNTTTKTIEDFLQQCEELQKLLNQLDKKYDKLERKNKILKK